MKFETYTTASNRDNVCIVTRSVMVERILHKQKIIFLAITVIDNIFKLDNAMHV